jgi:hypothetical protein
MRMARAVVIGTAATSPMVPTALRRISWARKLACQQLAGSAIADGDEQEQRQRSAGVGEHDGIDGGADVGAPDPRS